MNRPRARTTLAASKQRSCDRDSVSGVQRTGFQANHMVKASRTARNRRVHDALILCGRHNDNSVVVPNPIQMIQKLLE